MKDALNQYILHVFLLNRSCMKKGKSTLHKEYCGTTEKGIENISVLSKRIHSVCEILKGKWLITVKTELWGKGVQ